VQRNHATFLTCSGK